MWNHLLQVVDTPSLSRLVREAIMDRKIGRWQDTWIN